MATLSAQLKAGILRSLWRAADPDSGVLLSDVLAAYQDQCFTAVKTGRLIVSTAGSGHSTQFEIPSIARSFNPQTIFELSEEFFQIYSDALISLSAQGINTPTQAQIFDTMMSDDRVGKGIRSYQLDTTAIRFPSYGPAGASS